MNTTRVVLGSIHIIVLITCCFYVINLHIWTYDRQNFSTDWTPFSLSTPPCTQVLELPLNATTLLEPYTVIWGLCSLLRVPTRPGAPIDFQKLDALGFDRNQSQFLHFKYFCNLQTAHHYFTSHETKLILTEKKLFTFSISIKTFSLPNGA